MNRNLLAVARAFLGVLIVSWAAFSVSGLTNGNFSSGLSGWSSLGSTFAVGTQGNIVPVGGSMQALIGSGSDNTADAIIRKGGVPTKHVRAARRTAAVHPINPLAGDPNFPDIAEATLESTLGLTAGAIHVALPNNYTPTNGSVLYQSFAVTAPSTLTFYWNFATNEMIPSQWDAALYSLQSGSNTAQVFELADTTQSSVLNQNPGAASNFAAMTGYTLKSVNLPSAGTYTIGFFSMQTGDDSVSSATYISNVQVNGSGPSVPSTPAPATLSLGLLGLGMLALYSGVRKLRQV